MNDVRLVTVRSEIAAGTRGAALGIDAMIVASLDNKSTFFAEHESVNVEDANAVLFKKNKFPNAKYINKVHEVLERVCETTSSVMESDYFPVVLAGDHSTAAGTICGVKKANPDKRLGVIWIDAHADLHSPYTTPSGNMHGMPLAMVSNEDNMESKVNDPDTETTAYWDAIKNVGTRGPKIEASDIVFISVRDTEGPENVLMRKHGIRNFKTEEVREKGTKQIAAEALEQLSHCDIIYVSFDVDSMDSRISKGTGTPVENGLTVEEALELNKLLVADKRVCAWEIVEVNPTLDRENTMAENAFRILSETVNVIEKRLGKNNMVTV
ncbi:arginase [Limibacter armeniacum]|uniref:arginase n=1 Tax=Limibacter armeniacum TaxID=466084 RepID=UPI002FE6312E